MSEGHADGAPPDRPSLTDTLTPGSRLIPGERRGHDGAPAFLVMFARPEERQDAVTDAEFDAARHGGTPVPQRDDVFSAARLLVGKYQDEFAAAGAALDRVASVELAEQRVPSGQRRDHPDLLHIRCGLIGEAILRDREPIAGWMNFEASAPLAERRRFAAAFLLGLLLTADPDASEVLTYDVTVFARLPWYGEPNMMVGRCLFDWSDGEWRDSGSLPPHVLTRAARAIRLLDGHTSQAAEAPTTADDARNSPGGGRATAKAVSKLDGWTRAELIAQAKHDGAACSGTTFDTIRKAAEIPAAEKGGAGAQRRFSVAQLRKLIEAAKAGNFRDGKMIATLWNDLLPDS